LPLKGGKRIDKKINNKYLYYVDKEIFREFLMNYFVVKLTGREKKRKDK